MVGFGLSIFIKLITWVWTMLNVTEFHQNASDWKISFNGIGNNTNYAQNNLESH